MLSKKKERNDLPIPLNTLSTGWEPDLLSRRLFLARAFKSLAFASTCVVAAPFLSPDEEHAEAFGPAGIILIAEAIVAIGELIMLIHNWKTRDKLDYPKETINIHNGDNNIIINCWGCGRCIEYTPSPQNPGEADAYMFLECCPAYSIE